MSADSINSSFCTPLRLETDTETYGMYCLDELTGSSTDMKDRQPVMSIKHFSPIAANHVHFQHLILITLLK